MSYLSKHQSQLVRELVLDRTIDADTFAREFPVDADRLANLGLSILEASLDSRDRDDVSAGMNLAFHAGLTDTLLDVLLRLAKEPWHYSHEDIAMALDRLHVREDRVVDALLELATTQYEYLRYDDAFALGVKCIWALGNMGTVEAVSALGTIGSLGNEIFAENVDNQLDRIQARRPSDDVRAAIERARR